VDPAVRPVLVPGSGGRGAHQQPAHGCSLSREVVHDRLLPPLHACKPIAVAAWRRSGAGL